MMLLQVAFDSSTVSVPMRDGVHLHTRIFVVGDRIYQLFVVGPPALISAKEAGKFFDSFQVKAP